jgi:predicted metal-dependent peptidase
MKNINTYTPEQLNDLKFQTLRELEELIYLMIKEMPFYALILSKFRREINFKEIPIAAVYWDKVIPVLVINPFGFNHYTKKEQMFILIHEVLHITYSHHRRGKGLNHQLSNIAADIEINQLISSSIAVRPKDCLMPNLYGLPERLTFEEYYKLLLKLNNLDEMPEELKGSKMEEILSEDQEQGEGQGSESEGNSSEGQGSEGGQSEGEGSTSGQGQGSGTNGEQSQDESSAGDSKEGKETENKSNGEPKKPNYENLHKAWEKNDEISEEMTKGILKGILREAVIKTAGNIPGEMKSIIEELEKPQIKWTTALRTFASSVLSSDKRSTWNRPNRRTGKDQMGSLRKKRLNLLVAIDTSGSLSADELRLFLSEIKGIKKQTNAEITIVQCDARIQSVQSWNEINIDQFEVFGGGGTDLCPPFELAKTRKWGSYKLSEVPDGIVYLTDGYGPAPEICSIKTLFVISPGGRIPYDCKKSEDVTWGRKIYLNQ